MIIKLVSTMSLPTCWNTSYHNFPQHWIMQLLTFISCEASDLYHQFLQHTSVNTRIILLFFSSLKQWPVAKLSNLFSRSRCFGITSVFIQNRHLKRCYMPVLNILFAFHCHSRRTFNPQAVNLCHSLFHVGNSLKADLTDHALSTAKFRH